MISLRKLELKDAPLMWEWMQDEDVVGNLQTDFKSKTIDDCEKFIISSWNDDKNVNLAIVDENDEYMGTVSLKNITSEAAEFAITIRKKAMGKGYSQYAMKEILRMGIEEMGLKQIYWCVSRKNVRAVRFYDKNGYERIAVERLKDVEINYTQAQIQAYIWYMENSRGKKD